MPGLYNPFRDFSFNDSTCFLSGAKSGKLEKATVFPQWILDEFQLADKPFKLLDESIITYQDIQVPCSPDILEAIQQLDTEIQQAFTSGFAAVEQLDDERLFLWIAKMVYGIIYHEIRVGLRQQALSGEPMNFSQSLVHKLGNLHLMLQALIRLVVFDEPKPWSIQKFPISPAEKQFSYRDEVNTLIFSLRMNDFGLICCLQDMGVNQRYHKTILDTIGKQTLHPIQFEEICARFFYSAYLLNRLPEFTVLPTSEAVFIEPMPLQGMSGKPIFDTWDVKTYGQVLENFWKPWGYLLFEIIKNPDKPMSFLTDETGAFIPAEQVILTT